MGRNRQFYTNNLSLQNGAELYYIVKAINGKGLFSIGVGGPYVVDTTTTKILEVQDEGKYKNEKMNLNQLSFKVKVKLPRGLIRGYKGYITKLEETKETKVVYFGPNIGFSVSENNQQTTGEITSGTILVGTRLPLKDDELYYIYVSVLNEAGVWSEMVKSDGIRVDVTAPSKPKAGGAIYAAPDLKFLFTAADEHSGIAGYRYRIKDKSNGYLDIFGIDTTTGAEKWTQWYPVNNSNQTDTHGKNTSSGISLQPAATGPLYREYSKKPFKPTITVSYKGLSLFSDKKYFMDVQTKDDAGNISPASGNFEVNTTQSTPKNGFSGSKNR